MIDDVWLTIPAYPQYSVSSHGQVRNDRTGHVLTPTRSRPKTGGLRYCFVRLYDGTARNGRSVSVHRLVAAAFLGPRPNGHQVNHKDGDKTHNAAGNLEYVTASQNARHALDVLGRKRRASHGVANGAAKLTADLVRSARENYKAGYGTFQELADDIGISRNVLRLAIRRVTWAHVA